MTTVKKRVILAGTAIAVVAALLYVGSYVFSYDALFRSDDPLLFGDVARLDPATVRAVESGTTVEELQALVADARAKGLKVSIAGSRHSQGGHTYVPGGVVLDMSSFDRVLALDTAGKVIRVQSGAQWSDVQDHINPFGLAVKVMQSSNVFTVGGTLSANAHGRDLDRSSVVETVRSFRLLMADGRILNVSRTENAELFGLVIGGYGLFGVILDVDLELTDNEIYEQRSAIVDYRDFPAYVRDSVQASPTARMMLARPSIASETFLREMVVATWHATDRTREGIRDLTEESNVLRDRFFFDLSRRHGWAKDLRWRLQKRVELGVGDARIMSRTNAMRPPLAPLAFLDYYSTDDTDIIQEYFIPERSFVPFMDEFRETLLAHDANVISLTVRHVRANDETVLAYAPREDAFAIIHMSNVGLSEEAQETTARMTRELVDAAIRHGGTYYLTYQLYPTPEQMRRAYPDADLFFARKLEYDPEEMFVSLFYETYAR
ncbi:MAG: FAD-binding oxidoreductase [Gemmatimonadetes bacterium]|nr:FAD-binding oxidoreductase [Gemmatimonadota bacterium]